MTGDFKMKSGFRFIAGALLAGLIAFSPARAQMSGQVQSTPMGSCQLSPVAATGLSACVRASFTGTGTGTTLAASAITGYIKPNDQLSGTGVPAGTYIVAQLTGSPGGAGNYQTSQPTTSSGASLTSGGIPNGANSISISAETANVRYTDDGTVLPTSSTGQQIIFGQQPFWYQGSLAGLSFISATGKVDVLFYKTP